MTDPQANAAKSMNYPLYFDEEDPSDYKTGGYYPVHIGEKLNNRYLVEKKLGWGHFSTVWYCTDTLTHKGVAVKIVRSSPNYMNAAQEEIKLLSEITQNDKSNQYCVCHLLDSFHIKADNLYHVCMVFESLGVNIFMLIRLYHPFGVPLPIAKYITFQILLSLAYLHHNLHIIHTDLKPENVLLCFPIVFSGDRRTNERGGEWVSTPASSNAKDPAPQNHLEHRIIPPFFAKYNVKLSDFGNAIRDPNYRYNPAYHEQKPASYTSRAAEIESHDLMSIKLAPPSLFEYPSLHSATFFPVVSQDISALQSSILNGRLSKHLENRSHPLPPTLLPATTSYYKELLKNGMTHGFAFNAYHPHLRMLSDRPSIPLFNGYHSDRKSAGLVDHRSTSASDGAVIPHLPPPYSHPLNTPTQPPSQPPHRLTTRQYRSPESVLGCLPSSHLDLFSLGCVVWELISGRVLLDPRGVGEGRGEGEDEEQWEVEMWEDLQKTLEAIESARVTEAKHKQKQEKKEEARVRSLEKKALAIIEGMLKRSGLVPTQAVDEAVTTSRRLRHSPASSIESSSSSLSSFSLSSESFNTPTPNNPTGGISPPPSFPPATATLDHPSAPTATLSSASATEQQMTTSSLASSSSSPSSSSSLPHPKQATLPQANPLMNFFHVESFAQLDEAFIMNEVRRLYDSLKNNTSPTEIKQAMLRSIRQRFDEPLNRLDAEKNKVLMKIEFEGHLDPCTGLVPPHIADPPDRRPPSLSQLLRIAIDQARAIRQAYTGSDAPKSAIEYDRDDDHLCLFRALLPLPDTNRLLKYNRLGFWSSELLDRSTGLPKRGRVRRKRSIIDRVRVIQWKKEQELASSRPRRRQALQQKLAQKKSRSKTAGSSGSGGDSNTASTAPNILEEEMAERDDYAEHETPTQRLRRLVHSETAAAELASFLSCCLTWLPEDRWTALELLNHPWLRIKESDLREWRYTERIRDRAQRLKRKEIRSQIKEHERRMCQVKAEIIDIFEQAKQADPSAVAFAEEEEKRGQSDNTHTHCHRSSSPQGSTTMVHTHPSITPPPIPSTTTTTSNSSGSADKNPSEHESEMTSTTPQADPSHIAVEAQEAQEKMETEQQHTAPSPLIAEEKSDTNPPPQQPLQEMEERKEVKQEEEEEKEAKTTTSASSASDREEEEKAQTDEVDLSTHPNLLPPLKEKVNQLIKGRVELARQLKTLRTKLAEMRFADDLCGMSLSYMIRQTVTNDPSAEFDLLDSEVDVDGESSSDDDKDLPSEISERCTTLGELKEQYLAVPSNSAIGAAVEAALRPEAAEDLAADKTPERLPSPAHALSSSPDSASSPGGVAMSGAPLQTSCKPSKCHVFNLRSIDGKQWKERTFVGDPDLAWNGIDADRKPLHPHSDASSSSHPPSSAADQVSGSSAEGASMPPAQLPIPSPLGSDSSGHKGLSDSLSSLPSATTHNSPTPIFSYLTNSSDDDSESEEEEEAVIPPAERSISPASTQGTADLSLLVSFDAAQARAQCEEAYKKHKQTILEQKSRYERAVDAMPSTIPLTSPPPHPPPPPHPLYPYPPSPAQPPVSSTLPVIIYPPPYSPYPGYPQPLPQYIVHPQVQAVYPPTPNPAEPWPTYLPQAQTGAIPPQHYPVPPTTHTVSSLNLSGHHPPTPHPVPSSQNLPPYQIPPQTLPNNPTLNAYPPYNNRS